MTVTVRDATHAALSHERQWADGIQSFSNAQQRRGIGAATLERRIEQLARFARDCPRGPWLVTVDDVFGWLASLPVAPITLDSYRDSLRAFYRWAHSAGRVATDPTAEESRRAKPLPVPEVWTTPIQEYRSWLRATGHPETTVKLRVNQISRFARDHASLSPWDVSLDDLVEWISGKRWAPETRRAQRSALRGFYQWAKDTQRVRKSPAKKMPVIKATHPHARPALEDDYARALRRADTSDAVALRLAAELGLRRAEVAQVHARDLTGSAGAWILTVIGKGARVRYLPVPDALALTLRTRGTGYIFPGRIDGHVSTAWLGKRISALLPEGVAMHALRHRFATRAYAVDRDTFAVQQLLGHASAATTQRYVQVPDVARRKIVEAVGVNSS